MKHPSPVALKYVCPVMHSRGGGQGSGPHPPIRSGEIVLVTEGNACLSRFVDGSLFHWGYIQAFRSGKIPLPTLERTIAINAALNQSASIWISLKIISLSRHNVLHDKRKLVITFMEATQALKKFYKITNSFIVRDEANFSFGNVEKL